MGRLIRPLTLLTIAALALTAQSSRAVDLYWDANGTAANTGTTATGTWGTSVFWNTSSTGTGGTVTAATGNTDDLHFSSGTNYTGVFTVTVSGAQAANSIIFEEGTVTLSGGTSITLGGGGGANPGLSFVSGTGPNKINTSLILASSATAFTNADNSDQQINGGITGTSNLTLNANSTGGFILQTADINNTGTITNSGSGTGDTLISATIGSNVTGVIQNTSGGSDLILSGNNTSFAGGVTLSAGTLRINSNGALGTGTFIINGGVITNTSGAAVTSSGNNAQTWGGDFTFAGTSGTNDLNLGTGAVTLAGNRQVNVTGTTSTLTIGGTIADGGSGFSLTKGGGGTGTLILTGDNTYSGATIVSSGTLSASGANTNQALGGTSSVTVNSGGTLLLGNANQINNTAGMTLAGGTFNTGGFSESLGALTLNSSSTIDLASGSSILSFGGTSTRTAGTLTISNWSGSQSGGGTDQLLFANTLSQTFLDNINFTGFTPGAFQLGTGEVVPAPEPSTWIGGALAVAAIGFTQRKRFAKRLRVIS